MAYVTGSAGDLTALLTAIRAACTDNGWTLSGAVLHKGDAYISGVINSTGIRWQGGTGIDGGNALTGAAPRYVRNDDFGSRAITYPVTYEVHINTSPDEVYVVLNYAVSYYQFVAWGLSDIADLPGTGMWFGASRFGVAGGANGTTWDFRCAVPSSYSFTGANRGGAMFYANSNGQNAQTCYIHHDLDGRGWSNDDASSNMPWSFPAVVPLLQVLPNTWNDQTVLLPFPVYIPRSSGNKVSLVADLKHIRHCRIDYHNPGDIVTLGADQWKLYPWYLKNSTIRQGNDGDGGHSGTLGFAVRYTGS